MKKIILILSLLVPFLLNGQNILPGVVSSSTAVSSEVIYYVSTTGNNGNSGLDSDHPFATLAYTETHTPAICTVKLKKGDVFRETLTVSQSGTVTNNRAYSSYGTGANPQILGSNIATTWTNTSGNIWKTDITFTDPRTSGNKCDLLFMKSAVVHYGLYKANTGSFAAEFDWTWNANYIYVYSTTDPASAYTWVEIPQRTFGVDLNGKEYLSFSGIDFMYQVFNCIYGAPTSKTNLTIDGCNFSYIGGSITNDTDCTGYGISASYTNMTIKNSEFHNCGRRAISLDIYGNSYTATNCVIENNYFHDGYHTTGVDIKSGGGYSGAWNGITIRKNLFYDPVASTYGTEQMWIEQGSGGSLQNIYIYSNIFQNAPSGHACIHTQGYDSSHGPTGLFIYNNTFHEHSSPTTATSAMIWLYYSFTVKIKNNVFYSTKSDDSNYSAIMIYCYGGAQDYTQVDVNYNDYWTSNASARIIVANGNSYNKTQFSTWKSALSWDANSPTPVDPKLTSTTDYHLQSSSTIKASGVDLTSVAATDYENYSFNTNPSLGAYQYH